MPALRRGLECAHVRGTHPPASGRRAAAGCAWTGGAGSTVANFGEAGTPADPASFRASLVEATSTPAEPASFRYSLDPDAAAAASASPSYGTPSSHLDDPRSSPSATVPSAAAAVAAADTPAYSAPVLLRVTCCRAALCSISGVASPAACGGTAAARAATTTLAAHSGRASSAATPFAA